MRSAFEVGVKVHNTELSTDSCQKDTNKTSKMDIALKMKVQDSQMSRLSWYLRNGTSVKVGQGKFECTEAFFDPSLLDME